MLPFGKIELNERDEKKKQSLWSQKEEEEEEVVENGKGLGVFPLFPGMEVKVGVEDMKRVKNCKENL